MVDNDLTRSQKSLKFEHIIGQSSVLKRIFEKISLIAKTDSNVLIYGETGTGKELIARTIHNQSLNHQNDFVPVDCVALPANLLESELFGYEKGAFTGAVNRKYGLLEFANNGTLFLDEISELSANLQAKLLRVLQERQFRRVGGKALINVNIRIIAAMNKNPHKAVLGGLLRKDLYYRLSVIPIYIPPLRKRKEDIPLLVKYFLQKTIQKNSFEPKTISRKTMNLLVNYCWPGNVRQLQNMIERLALLTPKPVIDVEDLPDNIKSLKNSNEISCLPLVEAKRKHLENFEKEYLKRLLKETNNNRTRAAEIAGVSVRTIFRMLNRYNISDD